MRWLGEECPDVVALQETKTSDDRFAERYQPAFEAAGFGAAFHGEARYNGVAILSRHPIQVTTKGLPEQGGLGPRLLAVMTAGLSFTTVYVPSVAGSSRPKIERKLAWLDSLHTYLRNRGDEGLPAVLCGDFNIAPEPMDDWMHWHGRKRGNREPGFRDDERSRIRSLAEAGWFDLVRETNPGRGMFSWWHSADLYRQNKGLRLDLILGNRAVLNRLRFGGTDQSPLDQRDRPGKPDHAPVVVDLA